MLTQTIIAPMYRCLNDEKTNVKFMTEKSNVEGVPSNY